jgi:hypothetical protein
MTKNMIIQGGYPGVKTSVYVHSGIESVPGMALLTFYTAGSSMTVQISAYELGELASLLNTAREELAVTA